MNCLGFEGRGVKVKIPTRSDFPNFGTPYLLNDNQIFCVIQHDARMTHSRYEGNKVLRSRSDQGHL